MRTHPPKVGTETQARVLRAYHDGARTYMDVLAATAFALKTIQNTSWYLKHNGLIVKLAARPTVYAVTDAGRVALATPVAPAEVIERLSTIEKALRSRTALDMAWGATLGAREGAGA